MGQCLDLNATSRPVAAHCDTVANEDGGRGGDGGSSSGGGRGGGRGGGSVGGLATRRPAGARECYTCFRTSPLVAPARTVACVDLAEKRHGPMLHEMCTLTTANGNRMCVVEDMEWRPRHLKTKTPNLPEPCSLRFDQSEPLKAHLKTVIGLRFCSKRTLSDDNLRSIFTSTQSSNVLISHSKCALFAPCTQARHVTPTRDAEVTGSDFRVCNVVCLPPAARATGRAAPQCSTWSTWSASW